MVRVHELARGGGVHERVQFPELSMAAACDSLRPVDDRLVVAVNLDKWLLTRESCSRAGGARQWPSRLMRTGCRCDD